jgi:hypothetical protein
VISVVFLAVFFITLSITSTRPPRENVPQPRKGKTGGDPLFFRRQRAVPGPGEAVDPKEKETEAQAQEIIRALLAGSKIVVRHTLPEKAELADVKLEDDTLSSISRRASSTNHPGGSAAEMATVYP